MSRLSSHGSVLYDIFDCMCEEITEKNINDMECHLFTLPRVFMMAVFEYTKNKTNITMPRHNSKPTDKTKQGTERKEYELLSQ